MNGLTVNGVCCSRGWISDFATGQLARYTLADSFATHFRAAFSALESLLKLSDDIVFLWKTRSGRWRVL
jgi:hypothetical protein